jgi:hypothetical protein
MSLPDNETGTETVVCSPANLHITPPCGCRIVLLNNDGQQLKTWGCQHFYGSYFRTTQTAHYHRCVD